MALAGRAVMINWSDVDEEHRAAFYEWHNREHMIERVSIPGFRRGRRYRAEYGDLGFFNFYEADDFAVLVGRDYMERLNNPTEWTRNTSKHIRNNNRALAHVRLSIGSGQGSHMLTLRFDARPGAEEQLATYLQRVALPPIADMAQILGIHLVVADKAASSVITEEKRNRPPMVVPSWMILIEGMAVDTLEHAYRAALTDEVLDQHGGLGPYARGVYLLQNSVTAIDIAKPS